MFSSLFSGLHVYYKHTKTIHVIFNPIKTGLNCIPVIDNHAARRRLGPLYLPYSQRPRQLMFPETSDAAHKLTRRDASVKASKTGHVHGISREKKKKKKEKSLKKSAKIKRNVKVSHYVSFLKQFIFYLMIITKVKEKIQQNDLVHLHCLSIFCRIEKIHF